MEKQDDIQVEIENQVVYAFDYSEFNFMIEYNITAGEWFAVHSDENKEDRIIILTDMKEDIDIFGYEFTIDEFKDLLLFVEDNTNRI